MSLNAHAAQAYFSNSYREGREKFYETCKIAGLSPAAYVHPELKGPEGEDLAIDCVWLGPKNAGKAVMLACGTHGLEAAAGAATIVQWLSGDHALPDDTAVLIVHAVNPYGWAYASRGNEDGIDLNRNCLDHKKPHPDNPAYRELHPLIKSAGATPEALDVFSGAFAQFCAKKGFGYAVTGVTGGQYEFPDGISYGGADLSWSSETLYKIARGYLGAAEKVFILDWHTGIGAYGEPFFILDHEKSSPQYELAASWWPSHDIHCGDTIDGISPDYKGLLTDGLKSAIEPLNKAHVIGLVIEWGTYEVNAMLQALLLDRWLRLNRDNENRALVEDVRRRLIERFYPAAADWREAVLEKAQKIYAEAFAGVAAW